VLHAVQRIVRDLMRVLTLAAFYKFSAQAWLALA